MNGHLSSVQENLSALLGINAEYSPGGLGPARSHQSGKSHNFPFIQGEIHITHHPACIQIFYFQDLFPFFAGNARKLFLNFTSHHVGNYLIQGCVPEIHRGYVLAVPHYGHTVHNGLKLLQPVGNVHDAASLFPQVMDDSE